MDEGKIFVSEAIADERLNLTPGNIPDGYIGLCRFCIFNMNAAFPIRVGPYNTGPAKEAMGKIVTFGPWNDTIKWEQGATVNPGVGLAALFLAFGTGLDLRTPGQNERIPGFAVTMVDGTLVCEVHNIEMYNRPAMRRSVR